MLAERDDNGRRTYRLHPEIILGFHGLCLVKPVSDEDWYMGTLNDDGSVDCWSAYGDLYEALRGLSPPLAPLQVTTARPVSVSSIHGRSSGIEGGGRSHGRPSTNVSERPCTHTCAAPPQLESVRLLLRPVSCTVRGRRWQVSP